MAIRVFISDIDGCLAEPYCAFTLADFVTLADFARRAEDDPRRPRFSLCSGRAYPYVEAMSQVLGLRIPVLFESGGGMFDPVAARVRWSPAFSPSVAEQIEEVRHWLIREAVPNSGMMYDYGKRTQAGIVGPDAEEVAAWVPRVSALVEAQFPDLVVFHTPVSIDVVAGTITKREAMHWLADEMGIDVAEMAYIGDTNGDLGALTEVGYAFAPANAAPAVREAVEHVTAASVSGGVIEAYAWCLRQNGLDVP